MIYAIARVTALTGISMVVGNVLKTTGGALKTVATGIKTSNNCVRRAAEQAELNSQTKDIEFRMELKGRQKESTIKYGEQLQKLKGRWEDIDPKIQDELNNWDKRFPDC